MARCILSSLLADARLALKQTVILNMFCRQFGSPKVGIEAGPVKFDRRAELFNGRAAMFGYSLLAFLEYRSDITRAALYWAQNLQNIKPPGTSI